MNGRYYGQREIRWNSRERNGWNTSTSERRKMKALVEIVLIWGIVLALILAAFLLNFWLVHHIEILVGAKATWYIIGAGALMAAIWIFGVGKKA